MSSNCEKVTDVQTRQDLLRKARRCFVCLRYGHSSTSCRTNRTCKNCGGKHHEALCFKDQKGNNKPPESTRDVSNQENSTVTASAKVNSSCIMLMQTAKAYVYGGEDKGSKTLVNILFDSGSQKSYVTASF